MVEVMQALIRSLPIQPLCLDLVSTTMLYWQDLMSMTTFVNRQHVDVLTCFSTLHLPCGQNCCSSSTKQSVSQQVLFFLAFCLDFMCIFVCLIVFHETKFDSTHLYGCCLVIQCCDCCLVKIVPAHGPTTPSNWYGRRAAGGFASGTSLIHHTVGQCVYLDVYKSDTRDQLLWRCRFSLHNIDQYKAG